MVKFALLSFAVFAVIVGAFIFFGSSEEKPKKNTGSEEVSHETDPRDNNNPPQDKSWTDHSSKGPIVGATQNVPPIDSVQPHSQSGTMPTHQGEGNPGSKNAGDNPYKNPPGKQEEQHDAVKPQNADNSANGNTELEAPPAPGEID